MMDIVMKADMSKSSSGHKLAAATARLAGEHMLKKAPSGAHAQVVEDIPAGQYTVTIVDGSDGVHLVLSPGTVP